MDNKDIEDRISELSKEIDRLKKKRDAVQSLSQEQQLAIVLHNELCNINHIDGCDWFYDVYSDGNHNWHGYAHKTYLKKASQIAEFAKKQNIEVEVVIEVIKLINKR